MEIRASQALELLSRIPIGPAETDRKSEGIDKIDDDFGISARLLLVDNFLNNSQNVFPQ